ncbi:MAG: TonB-dependent receptor [Caulobacteraceae bacterium]|nr:TonB-dependent receptor [Caulobacteraceae bacterium]
MTNRANIRRSILAAGVGLAALAAAHGSFAQNATFNIPAGDAATALAAWSAVSGIKIDAPETLTRGVKTAAVSGNMDAHDALNTMIAGTKLQILQDDTSQISLGSAAGDTVSTVNVSAIGTNISGVKAVGSPIQRVSREDLLKTGATDIQSALRTLPLIQTAGGVGDSGNIGGVVRGGVNNQQGFGESVGVQTADIGGNGSRATLVLLDGQRLAQTGLNTSLTDISQVPMSALGAIEIIPDGASAIYGTDAISGVINLVTRRNYQGFSVSADYYKDDFTPRYGGAVTAGKAWNWLQGGNVLVTYDSHVQTTAFQDANQYTRRDRRPVGGNLTQDLTPASNTPYINTSACLVTQPGQIATLVGNSTIPANGVNVVPGTTTIALENLAANSCVDGAATGVTLTSGRTIPKTVVNYGLPPGFAGGTPTYAQLVSPTANLADPTTLARYAVNAIPLDTYTPYLSGNKTQNVLIALQQKFSDSIDGSIKLNYNIKQQDGQGFRNSNLTGFTPTTIAGTFSPTAVGALYPDSTAAGGTGQCLPGLALAGATCPAITVFYPFGRFRDQEKTTQYQYSVGLNINNLPFGWTAKFTSSANGSNYIGNFIHDGALNGTQQQAGAASILSAYLITGQISPYIAPNTNPLFRNLLGYQDQEGYRTHADGQVVFNGPIFNIPGGTIKGSVLFYTEYDMTQKIDYNLVTTPTGLRYLKYPGTTNTPLNRTANRANRVAVEFYIPVVGEANAIPGIQEFTLDIAANHQVQSHAQTSSTDPQVSFNYRPISDLTVRGTWSTSFRAPDLSESSSAADQTYANTRQNQSLGFSGADLVAFLTSIGATNLNAQSYFNGTDPNTQTVTFALDGGLSQGHNAFLHPETSTSITAGFDYKPKWLSGLSVSATYRSLEYKDKIVNLGSGGWLNNLATAQAYQDYIKPITRLSSCDPLDATTWPIEIQNTLPDGGVLLARGSVPGVGGGPARVCDAQILLGGGPVNTPGTKEETGTLIASYRFNTPIGTFSADTNIQKIFTETQEISPGHGLYTNLDYIGAKNSIRSRSSVSWSKGPLSLQVYANYVGPYTNDQQTTLNNRGSLNSTSSYSLLPCDDRVPVPGGVNNFNNTAANNGVALLPSNGAYPGLCRLPIYKVPSWTTFDLVASYRTNADAPYWRRNVRLSMNVNNFLGKAPPYAMNGSNVYDPANANILGRVWSFKIDKEF